MADAAYAARTPAFLPRPGNRADEHNRIGRPR
jgi:hypothetical protein